MRQLWRQVKVPVLAEIVGGLGVAVIVYLVAKAGAAASRMEIQWPRFWPLLLAAGLGASHIVLRRTTLRSMARRVRGLEAEHERAARTIFFDDFDEPQLLGWWIRDPTSRAESPIRDSCLEVRLDTQTEPNGVALWHPFLPPGDFAVEARVLTLSAFRMSLQLYSSWVPAPPEHRGGRR